MSRLSSRIPDTSFDARLADAGLVRIEQPMPFGPESANIYLGFGPPPFLIDTGLPAVGGWDLKEALYRHGVRIEDLAHVFLTHAHIDHAGATPSLNERYGTAIWAHPEEAPRLDGRQYRFLKNHLPILLSRLGFNHESQERFLASIDSAADVYRRQVVDRFEPLMPGARLPIEGPDIEVIHTPGHSAGSVCFLERRSGLLVSGDSLLSGGPPGAIISPDGEDSVPFDGLMDLEKSLDLLRSYNPETVFGGHGPPGRFSDAAALAKRSFRTKRAAVIDALRPGLTLFDLIRKKATGPPVAFLMAIGETRSAIEALLTEGRVRIEADAGVERYYPA